ncbi:MAG: hypothetical protein ACX930_11375 [Erythrobacter sp.]
MIGRILWLAALAAVAMVTVGVQLDRQARTAHTLAASVPEPFRSSAQLPYAAYTLAGDNPELALAEAEKLVRRRPLPAEHLRLLSQAQFAAGRLEEGTITIQYAAQRGWRDPLSQEAMLRLAIYAGDSPEAARRYAALFLRRDTKDALLKEVGPAVLAEPGGAGRQTLIEIVGGGERWHNTFLRRGSRVMQPDAFSEIVTETVASGTRYECPTLRQAKSAVEQRDPGAGAQMATVVEQLC